MSINFIRHQGYPLAMKRRLNVAKFEAMTGRLIWWRNYPAVGSDGRVDATSLPLYGSVRAAEIAPLHGTDDVVIWIDDGTIHSGAKGTLLRVPACGGQELDCIPWRTDLPISGGPLFPGDGYANQSQAMCGTADGRVHIGGGGAPRLWTRAYTADGAASHGYSYAPPLAVVPGASSFYARRSPYIDNFSTVEQAVLFWGRSQNLVRLSGGSKQWERAVVSAERLIAAAPNGRVLSSIRLTQPATTTAVSTGAVVRDGSTTNLITVPGSGASLTPPGADIDWFFYIDDTPTTITLIDPSVIASDTGTSIAGTSTTSSGNPRAIMPECGCGHGSRWYYTGPEFETGNSFVATDLGLSVIWRKENVGSFRRMFADDSGIYCVCRGQNGHDINGTLMALIKYDHDGNVIYGINHGVQSDACLSPDGQHLYMCG